MSTAQYALAAVETLLVGLDEASGQSLVVISGVLQDVRAEELEFLGLSPPLGLREAQA
jgi:hypothetical protein